MRLHIDDNLSSLNFKTARQKQLLSTSG